MASTSSVSQTTNNSKKIVAWDEFIKHNTETDCWISVRGKVYDVTSWIPKHPGGSDPIVFNGGRDGTQLFEAYHPIKVYSMLDKYYIGELGQSEHPSFPPMSDFYKSMKKKVEDYFVQNKISPRYAPEMLLRTFVLFLGLFVFHYFSVITASSSFIISSICAILVGVGAALLSLMPVHEASHCSTTESPLVWRLLGAIHDFVNGCGFFTWIHQHFLGHHPYTNVTDLDKEANDAIDPDVTTNNPDIRRIKPNQRWYNHYRFQAIYVPILYGLLGIKFRINDFTIMFVSKTNGSIRLTPPSTYHITMFIVGKIVFTYYRIILPCYYIPIWQSIYLFIISDLVTSYYLALMFQVNHVIPQAKWPTIDKEKGMVNMDWAEMQLATTLDYAHGSWWTTFFSGALNYQVTHHLFPYICQIHYPAIAPIIKEHCAKHGITYHYLPSLSEALKNHLNYLALMGHAHNDLH